MSRRLSLLSLFVVLASACSNSEESDALPLFDEVEAVAETTTTVIASTTTSTSAGSSTSAVDKSTTTEQETSDTTSTSTQGSGATAPPGNASAAPNGGGDASADVMSLYVGALGNYSLHQGLATSPVAMPTVAAGIAPLTGLPSSRANTSAIVVKIDNSSKARPQAGLDVADVVIEQEVEGGITRFAAIFQSSAPERIGPVRSARSTDISFLSALGQPGLAYSGANEVFDTLIVRQERVRNYSANRFGGYWRDTSRSAPSNLYTSMSQFSTQAAAPPAWFHFGTGASEQGSPVASFTARFPATSITWTWNGSAWDRAQDGRNHVSESGAVLKATNVVVAQVAVVDSGLKDPTGAIVPEFVWAGRSVHQRTSDRRPMDSPDTCRSSSLRGQCRRHH